MGTTPKWNYAQAKRNFIWDPFLCLNKRTLWTKEGKEVRRFFKNTKEACCLTTTTFCTHQAAWHCNNHRLIYGALPPPQQGFADREGGFFEFSVLPRPRTTLFWASTKILSAILTALLPKRKCSPKTENIPIRPFWEFDKPPPPPPPTHTHTWNWPSVPASLPAYLPT